jgi:hypothetical protein
MKQTTLRRRFYIGEPSIGGFQDYRFLAASMVTVAAGQTFGANLFQSVSCPWRMSGGIRMIDVNRRFHPRSAAEYISILPGP